MSDTRAMTITEFLDARIDDDETTPRTERVSAECAAKRMIVALHSPVKDKGWRSGASHGYLFCGSCGSIDDSPEPYPCDTLKALASIYMDHPDYNEEWARVSRD